MVLFFIFFFSSAICSLIICSGSLRLVFSGGLGNYYFFGVGMDLLLPCFLE